MYRPIRHGLYMAITLCFYMILAEDNDRGGDHLHEHFEWEDWMWNIVIWYRQYFSPHSLNKSSSTVTPATPPTYRSSLNWKGPTTLNTQTAKHKMYAVHAHCSFAKWDRILWEIFFQSQAWENHSYFLITMHNYNFNGYLFFCVAFYFSFIFMITYIYYSNIEINRKAFNRLMWWDVNIICFSTYIN